MSLVAPFPYFGGKRRHVGRVWDALGDVQAYIEPFCGSAAVLLGRPASTQPRRRELINDVNCWVTNFFRAVKADPDGVADAARWPINEIDLAARQHRFSEGYGAELRADPGLCDVELAGWWAWGMSCSISMKYPNGSYSTIPVTKTYRGANQRHVDLGVWCQRLAARLEHVQVACGQWDRVLSPATHMDGSHTVGVFLDPPYDPTATKDGRIYFAKSAEYAADNSAVAAAAWAAETGSDTRYRIVLCGFEAEHAMPGGWEYVPLGTVGKSSGETPEGMWLSPGCVRPSDGRLF